MDLLSFLISARFYPRPACRCTGHSMTEVLTTLAVVGVVVSSGAPAMQNLVHEQRLTTQVNQLFTDLHLARSESIKRSAQVTLCKSNDGAACSTVFRLAGWLDRVRWTQTETKRSIPARQSSESGRRWPLGPHCASEPVTATCSTNQTAPHGQTPRSPSAMRAAQRMPGQLLYGGPDGSVSGINLRTMPWSAASPHLS